ncbi:ABC transporter permease [Winogradskyella sp.]|uniref:ABC transporter permease n=1 Tax=Winogradskyella sp. TaxID=1883156 RepID=UPI003BACB154
MDIYNYYIINIKNEVLKLKNTFAIWLCLLGGAFIPAIYFIYYTYKYETLIPVGNQNPWDKFLTDQIMSSASLLIPLYIVLITSLIIQIEHKSGAIKFLFTQPVPKWSIYFGKLTIVVVTVVATYVIFVLLMIVSGYLVGIIHKELMFLEYRPNLEFPIKLLFRSFIACLGIIGIQFWISFRFKNFIIPLGAGMILVITGLIIFQAEEALYFPYAYNRLSLFALSQESGVYYWFPHFSLYSFMYFILFSVYGYFNINKMDIK